MQAWRPVTFSLFAALALSGCMQATAPVAHTEPQQGALDALAYGSPAIPAVRAAYAASPARSKRETSYRLDAGDTVRVMVYGEKDLTSTYAVDLNGAITIPLIGPVPARGKTPAALAVDVSAKLRNGFIRDPSVAVEIISYRPFFILGEVAAPGQYPYVPNMTVEAAVATAGGFSPRALRDQVTLTHNDGSGAARFEVPLGTAMSAGDTILVGER
jgi:polysaccharide biosynthesis/export protein